MGVLQKIHKEEIYAQIEKICLSRELNSKSQLCKLLRYIVKETLAGRQDKIKEYTIGTDLFERDVRYDTSEDPMVRINAGRLRRMLKLYYLQSGKNDRIRIEIPKGRYIPVFQLNTIESEGHIDKVSGRQKRTSEPTIAILPFTNMTGDPQNDYLSLGFSEELSIELTKFEDLVVFDSIHLSELKSENKLASLRDLQVRFVIEGSVNLVHDRVKIVVRLSDITCGKQIWAERYLRDFSAKNLVEIQENIAYEVSGELGSEYGIIPQTLSRESKWNKPQIGDTYNAILKYYYFEAHQTQEAARDAFLALEAALIKDPDSGIATAMLASIHGNRYALDLDLANESYRKMAELSEKAIQLDPNSITVRVAHAWKCFLYNDREAFIKDFDWCIRARPNSPMKMGSLGFHLSLFGDWERGKSILDQMMIRNLNFPLYYYGATTLYYYRIKDYDAALGEARQYDIPFLFWGPMLRAAIYGQLNRSDDARPHMDQVKQLKPDFEEKANYLISRFVKEKSLVDHVMDGLRKAGMSV